MARLRTACDQLETFLNRYSAELPTSLLPCLQLGGHLQPFLLLMEEATQTAPGGAGDAALYIALAETVDKKIVADLAFITRTMASAGSVEADKPGS